jgi:nitrite reductase/ring-hydroxylating ferredoxin subunit
VPQKRFAFPAGELPADSRRTITVEKREICVFDVGGRLYALRNICPHQQAPLSYGAIAATNESDLVGEYHLRAGSPVLTCPWHRYEFDLETGCNLVEPDRLRVKVYDVRREGDEIALYL